MLKLRAGDEVLITLGKDRNRKGKIEKVFPKKKEVLVPEVNVYKKHVKAAAGRKGGIYDISRPLAFSKVALICPSCKKTTRVGFKIVEADKLRVCKKCGREIDSKKKRK